MILDTKVYILNYITKIILYGFDQTSLGYDTIDT